MKEGKHFIKQFKTRWQLMLVVEALLYALGLGVLSWFVMESYLIALSVSIIVFIVAILLLRPWAIQITRAAAYIDKHLPAAEYSSSLTLASQDKLTGLAQLQYDKVTTLLSEQTKSLQPQTGIKKAVVLAMLFVFFGFLLSKMGVLPIAHGLQPGNGATEMVRFTAADSVTAAYDPPVLKNQSLRITYPSYTGKGTLTSATMNVKVVEGSRISWQLEFEGLVNSVRIEGMDKELAMEVSKNALDEKSKSIFAKAYSPKSSAYYNFRFTDSLNYSYVSDLYAIEVIEDQDPEIVMKDVAQFASFDVDEDKNLSFNTQITDDFGIASAQIIATVSKGSGESVKFREERLPFDTSFRQGDLSVNLSKKINLDQLQMEAGDELYFYVEASDLKNPNPNVARSETYFAVIKDTVSNGFGVEGTLGADLMPDYFRSQRQLIIDTEKLIKERSKLSVKEFKSQSNDLGFDQKALRLKYGQFMGDEDDSGIAINVSVPEAEDFDAEDPTAGFRHDHDDENEHNIVDHAHEEEVGEEEEKSPFEEYMHNHDDPEESTLFTESLKNKLQQAMAEMWDSELHLRLGDPKTSLPYQYSALKLIQEIKNSSRIYVHRIGFDPPPIKEETRLTGDIKEVDNFYKTADLEHEDTARYMRLSIEILEKRIQNNSALDTEDKDVLVKAGKELAQIAIDEPSKHLLTLQNLKTLTEEKAQALEVLKSVQSGLFRALPAKAESPSKASSYESRLKQLLTKELEQRER